APIPSGLAPGSASPTCSTAGTVRPPIPRLSVYPPPVALNSSLPVQGEGDSDQFVGRHRVTRYKKEQVGVVPGHDSGTAPVDVVRCRFRSELVDSRRVSCNLALVSGTAISHVERQSSGLGGTFARLTQHETTIMRLQR